MSYQYHYWHQTSYWYA